MTDILPIAISFGEAAKPVDSGEYLVRSSADSFSNLVTIDDATVTVIDFDASAGADSTTGPNYGNEALSVSPWISNNMCYDAAYLDSGNTGAYSFTSVPAGNYRLILAASRDVARGDGSRVTRFVVTTGTVTGSASVDVDAANPSSGTEAPYAEFLVAPVGGVIAFSFTAAPGSSYGYLSGAVLTEIVASVSIDATPAEIRVGNVGPDLVIRITAAGTAPTTLNTVLYIDADTNTAIAVSSVTNITGNTWDLYFDVPDAYAGLPYSPTGYVIIVSTADGEATSGNVPFLPVAGDDYVTLTDVSATDIESSPALEVLDQVEWTNAAVIDIDSEGKVTSSEASATFEFRVWDHDDSTWGDWAEATWGSGGSESNQNGVIVLGIINDGVIL